MAIVVRGIGLAGALVLISACNPGSSMPGPDEGTSSSETGSDEPPTDMMIEPQSCSLEAYASISDDFEFSCVPMPDSGLCSPCDEYCAWELCECQVGCYGHHVVCSVVEGGECCHVIARIPDDPIPAGRPLRDGDTRLIPDVVAASGRRSTIGNAYREIARAERASVDAFLHCAALLDELGAPPELVQRNRSAAREEAKHARLAVRAAESIDGVASTLTSTPSPRAPIPLAAFVRHLVLDGCIGEAGAALEARWALTQPEVAARPALREFWQIVAHEEARHAALAWETLEFLLEFMPSLVEPVRAALRQCLPVERPQVADDQPTELARAGIASSAIRTGLVAEALDGLVAEATRVSARQMREVGVA